MNNKPIQTFEDLNVYQRAYRISLEIHKETFSYPRQEQMRGIADQIRRASKGICANIAEGYGKQHISTAEFKRYLSIAIGSANEMRVWLSYARDLGYISQEQHQVYVEEYSVIAKMLNRLHRKWK